MKDIGRYLVKGERAAELVALRTKRLSVKSFMDAWTMNIERLQQCCVHVGSTDGEADPVRIPFCARQLFGNLRRRTSAGQVAARQLVRAGRPGGADHERRDRRPLDPIKAWLAAATATDPCPEVRPAGLHVLQDGDGRA